MKETTPDGKLSTIYFPLTANPIGFHHLLLAESIFWNFPDTKLIVFLISNGFHPDPSKRKKIPECLLRLEILMSALRDWADPLKSLPAKVAEDSGIFLKLGKNNCAVSRTELSFNESIHLSDNIKLFSNTRKIQIIVGADLIERMLNPRIFSDKDLEIISRESHLLIAPRNQIEIKKILERLKNERRVSFTFTFVQTNYFPQKLLRFFFISSTIIRKAIQAGHDLDTFLPKTARSKVLQNKLYKIAKTSNQIRSSYLNEFNLSCQELMKQLEDSAMLLLELLKELENSNRPHKFSIVETCTGGKISGSFTGLSGASNHFIDGRILYSKESQMKFLGKSFSSKSSVSETMVRNLAESMRNISGSDWALAETSMAGPPSNEKRSQKNGQCHLGLALKSEVQYKFLEFNPFLTRKEHQLLISIEAINWVKNVLKKLI